MKKELNIYKMFFLFSVLFFLLFARIAIGFLENVMNSYSLINFETVVEQTFRETYPDCISAKIKLATKDGRMIIAIECTEWREADDAEIKNYSPTKTT